MSELIKTCVNEENTALTVIALNALYPNVTFEGIETGTGYYEIWATAKYHNHAIFKSTQREFELIAWNIYSAMDAIKRAVKEIPEC